MVTGVLEVARDRHADILVVANQAEQDGGWNADLLAMHRHVVLHRVLAADARQPVSSTHLVDCSIGADELCELVAPVGRLLRLDRVRPAEVVQARYHVQVYADTDRVTQGLVNAGSGHGVGVDV